MNAQMKVIFAVGKLKRWIKCREFFSPKKICDCTISCYCPVKYSSYYIVFNFSFKILAKSDSELIQPIKKQTDAVIIITFDNYHAKSPKTLKNG